MFISIEIVEPVTACTCTEELLFALTLTRSELVSTLILPASSDVVLFSCVNTTLTVFSIAVKIACISVPSLIPLNT